MYAGTIPEDGSAKFCRALQDFPYVTRIRGPFTVRVPDLPVGEVVD
jgi:hypothetical protein